MVKRQLRVGELVDDYCPRERRLSDHAIVAMVDEDVRQVRCAACGGEHEYRGGKLPPARKKKTAVGPPPLPPAGMVVTPAPVPVEEPLAQSADAPQPVEAKPESEVPETVAALIPPAEEPKTVDGPFHRRLIRATLPRVEGQVPERRIPEFTMHNSGGRGPGGQAKSFRGGHGGPHRSGGGGRGAAGHSRQGGGGFAPQGNRQGQGGQGGHGGQAGGHGGHGGPAGGGHNRSSRPSFGGRRGGGKKP